ncbi:hypothetical protein CAPTEDRAFT_200846 [Capitella teleta]|uniref:Uncharacterized protein n=1 Tax=Capitella teleta TaxID=283909 RepID=R7TX69_CAPTE|nr:hypothetical protein CAPTEDRAFT_200846 [Capitella teleta]|eukprot:ELT96046.1 hypothetical protein CAPTEDRAFT_200846 [Capitella teleta]
MIKKAFEARLDTTWGRCNVINAREYSGSLAAFLKESDNKSYYENLFLNRSTRKRAKVMGFEDNPISIERKVPYGIKYGDLEVNYPNLQRSGRAKRLVAGTPVKWSKTL